MAGQQLGVVAAGHPRTARAGADVLRDGGNAVDAALAAMAVSFACEPLLTGLGAGGYMLVVTPDGAPTLLDFFVEAPGRGGDPASHGELDADRRLVRRRRSRCSTSARRRSGPTASRPGCARRPPASASVPLADLVAPGARLAREGVELNAEQAYVIEILEGIVTATPESCALFAPEGRVLRAGERIRQPELGDALERLGAEGSAPFYTGDIAAAIVDWLSGAGGAADGRGPRRLRGRRSASRSASATAIARC